MDFKFSTEEETFQNDVNGFLKQELPSDWTGETAYASSDDGWNFNLKMKKKLAEKG